MVSLPTLFEKLQIRLKSNLVFMAAVKSLGRGNLEGLKYFLANSSLPIHAGLCLEGVQLGRLNYSCLGMFRGEIVNAGCPKTITGRSSAPRAPLFP